MGRVSARNRYFRSLWKVFLGLWLLIACITFLSGVAEAVESVWAYPGYTGRMIYRPDEQGDRISDFSIVGYKQGKVAIPTNVPAMVTLTDDGSSDDTARIQAAINQVAAMPIGADGYRGAVFLQSGSYDILGQLTINASGVVLRGAGNGDTGTILHARGTDTRALINISGSGSRSLTGSTYSLIDKTVPAGANSFRVNSTVGLNVGDAIYLTRPSTAEWIHDIRMDELDIPWTPGSKNLNWERTITRIEGNRVFIDTPVTNSLESKYGGGTFRKYTYSGRIENVGVENLRGESDYVSDTDEAHSWDFITIDKSQNAWISGTRARYFANSIVTVNRDAKWVTIVNNISEMPKSQITGGRRGIYNITGQQNLITNNQSTDGRHDYIVQASVAGPNVFYNNTSANPHDDTGPHQRWSSGTLYDNISDPQGEINVQNRWNWGTGHGWAAANDVIWNSTAAGYKVQNPFTAQNWLIGSIGQIRTPTFASTLGLNPAYVDSQGTKVATNSLYQAQLEDVAAPPRDYQWTGGSGNWADTQKWVQLAVPSGRVIQMRDYLIGDIDSFTYDANADDDYYIDPTFRSQVESQFGSNIGGFDVVSANRNVAFTQQFALASNEQVVNASLALGMRTVSGSSINDKIMINGVGTFSLDSLGWTRTAGTTTVGVFDLGPYLAAMQNGNLSTAFNGNTAADWGILALQVSTDASGSQGTGANVTISGDGTVTVNSAVPAVSSLTINGSSTILDIVNGGQFTVRDVISQGLLRVSGGDIYVTGNMDNNSRVSIIGGTLKTGSSTALGSNSIIGTTINGGTLDVYGQNLSTETITVQGAGVGGKGAIINSSLSQLYALKLVTLSGDTTFGGTSIPPNGSGFGRWDIRASSGAMLSTGGHAYNLTKVGLNQVALVATTVDTTLGNININQGILAFQTSTNGMGDPNKTVTIASGAALNFYSTSAVMNKKAVLNGGTIWGESGTGSNNTFAGPITINSAGGVFDAGGNLVGGTTVKPTAVLNLSGPITGIGGVTKTGPGTVFITSTTVNYNGNTAITAGTMQIKGGSSATVALHAVTGAGNLIVDNATSLTADSINIGTLTIGAGSKVTLAPLPGGPFAGYFSPSPVPEPATFVMIVMGGLLMLLCRRKR